MLCRFFILILFLSGVFLSKAQSIINLTDFNKSTDTTTGDGGPYLFIQKKQQGRYIALTNDNTVIDIHEVYDDTVLSRSGIFTNCKDKVVLPPEAFSIFSMGDKLYYTHFRHGKYVFVQYDYILKTENDLIASVTPFSIAGFGNNTHCTFFQLRDSLYRADRNTIHPVDSIDYHVVSVGDSGAVYQSRGNVYFVSNSGNIKKIVNSIGPNPVLFNQYKDYDKNHSYTSIEYGRAGGHRVLASYNHTTGILDSTDLGITKTFVGIRAVSRKSDTTYLIWEDAVIQDSIFLVKIFNHSLVRKQFLIENEFIGGMITGNGNQLLLHTDATGTSYPPVFKYYLLDLTTNALTHLRTVSNIAPGLEFYYLPANKGMVYANLNGPDAPKNREYFAYYFDVNDQLQFKKMLSTERYSEVYYNDYEKVFYAGISQGNYFQFYSLDSAFNANPIFRYKLRTGPSPLYLISSDRKYALFRNDNPGPQYRLRPSGLLTPFEAGGDNAIVHEFIGRFGGEDLYYGMKADKEGIIALDTNGNYLQYYDNTDVNPGVIATRLVYMNGKKHAICAFTYTPSDHIYYYVIIDPDTKQTISKNVLPFYPMAIGNIVYRQSTDKYVTFIEHPNGKGIYELNSGDVTVTLIEASDYPLYYPVSIVYKSAAGAVKQWNASDGQAHVLDLAPYTLTGFYTSHDDSSFAFRSNNDVVMYSLKNGSKTGGAIPATFKLGSNFLVRGNKMYFMKNETGSVHSPSPGPAEAPNDTSFIFQEMYVSNGTWQSRTIDIEPYNYRADYRGTTWRNPAPLVDTTAKKIYYQKINLATCLEEFYEYDYETDAGSPVLMGKARPDSTRDIENLFKLGNRVYFFANHVPVSRELFYFTVGQDDPLVTGFTANRPNATTGNYLTVYPNPVAHSLKLQGVDAGDVFKYEIVNVHGHISKTGVAEKETGIDVAGLQPGMYVIRLQEKSAAMHCTFIKL